MKASEKVIGAVGIVIVTVVLLYMTPVIVDAVADINTTAWDFTGHEGAEALLGLVPFIWVAGVLISAAVGMFTLAKAPVERMVSRGYIAKLLRKMGRALTPSLI